ncbi:MAG: hypothetical protein ACXV2F_06045 [Halobacteriota archaeon]
MFTESSQIFINNPGATAQHPYVGVLKPLTKGQLLRSTLIIAATVQRGSHCFNDLRCAGQ